MTKVVNRVKPVREYRPEHAMSMAKAMGAVLVFVSVMMGVSYSEVKDTGRLRLFKTVNAALELVVDRIRPIVYRASSGGGTRNRRKAKGSIRVLRVSKLKRMRMSPVVNIGRLIRWYSRGVKVFEPCQ